LFSNQVFWKLSSLGTNWVQFCFCGFLGFPGGFGASVILVHTSLLCRWFTDQICHPDTFGRTALWVRSWLVNLTNFDIGCLTGAFGIREVLVYGFLRRSFPTTRNVAGLAFDAFFKLLSAPRSVCSLLLAGFGGLRGWTKRLLTEDLLFPELICVCQALVVWRLHCNFDSRRFFIGCGFLRYFWIFVDPNHWQRHFEINIVDCRRMANFEEAGGVFGKVRLASFEVIFW